MDIDELLKIAIESDASDLHLKAGNYPILRIHGKLSPLTSFPRLSPENTRELSDQVTNDFQKERLKQDLLTLSDSLQGGLLVHRVGPQCTLGDMHQIGQHEPDREVQVEEHVELERRVAR